MVIFIYFFSFHFNPCLNAYPEHLHLNANRTFQWNATPSLVPNINRIVIVFLIKKSDQLSLHSQRFLNYIN